MAIAQVPSELHPAPSTQPPATGHHLTNNFVLKNPFSFRVLRPCYIGTWALCFIGVADFGGEWVIFFGRYASSGTSASAAGA